MVSCPQGAELPERIGPCTVLVCGQAKAVFLPVERRGELSCLLLFLRQLDEQHQRMCTVCIRIAAGTHLPLREKPWRELLRGRRHCWFCCIVGSCVEESLQRQVHSSKPLPTCRAPEEGGDDVARLGYLGCKASGRAWGLGREGR